MPPSSPTFLWEKVEGAAIFFFAFLVLVLEEENAERERERERRKRSQIKGEEWLLRTDIWRKEREGGGRAKKG